MKGIGRRLGLAVAGRVEHQGTAQPVTLQNQRHDAARGWQHVDGRFDVAEQGIHQARLAGLDLAHAVTVLEDYLKSLRQGSFEGMFGALKGDPAFRMQTVLDLVVARIGTDYTSPRFLECFKDFMRGLAWRPESTMEELADRYNSSSQNIFLPFARRHEHLLENYLINYIFRTVFPYRSRLPDQKSAIDSSRESMRHSFVLLAVHYAIIRAMLIGMAALHKENLSIHHVVKLVQSYSKAFLHSTSFEAAAIEYLEKNVVDPARKVAELVMD